MAKPHKRTLEALSFVSEYARFVMLQWCAEIGRRHGERALALAERLLACVRCLKSIADELTSPDEGERCEFADSSTLPVAEPLAMPDKDAVDAFITEFYAGEDQEELQRGFSDLLEALSAVFQRLIPALLDKLNEGADLRAALPLGLELSRELEHVEYHLERDVLGRCRVGPSWDS